MLPATQSALLNLSFHQVGWFASVLGLTAGPLACLGGERLGAATFGDSRLLSQGVIGLCWAVALPILVWIADRLGGRGRYRIFEPVAEVRAQ